MKNYGNISTAIHKEGYIFIAICIFCTMFLSTQSSNLAWIGFAITGFCIFFFRNPDRVASVAEGFILSPADGIVVSITDSPPPAELGVEENMKKISIFLSPFNVHVNRIPIEGVVSKLHYNPGKFLNASLDKASKDNERQSILITTKKGVKVGVIQIAGMIARRIVCDLEENMSVKSAERFGIIRFGSRVDLYLPIDTVILVKEGQTMIGAETIMADLNYKGEQPEFKNV
jgi:phosphatidylserine decarboxylase